MILDIVFDGETYNVSSEYLGMRMWYGGMKHFHRVSVKKDSVTESFNYHCNTYELDEQESACAVYCFLSDASCYEDYPLKSDFADALGYKQDPLGRLNIALENAYDGCKRASEKCKSLGVDLYGMSQYLQEKYDF